LQIDFLIFPEDTPRSRRLPSGQGFHQGALARPILADKRVNFTRQNSKIDVLQRLDAGKGFADILHTEEIWFSHYGKK
jgi:hypothetical protein